MGALVVALYDNHTAAERVRTQLVSEGFPTDRVQLTSQSDLGPAAIVSKAEALEQQLEDYFNTLFTREDELTNVHLFVDGVQQGHAALTVHPRGEVETSRALEIMEQAQPLEMVDHDLENQSLERAATPHEREPMVKQLLDASKDATRVDKTRH